ncbi:uncharacterized protein DS421_12g376830 [Arachis hypogaea]|nr:uncharacterized protein DS421_12g376830 [Arachis hypogaea]
MVRCQRGAPSPFCRQEREEPLQSYAVLPLGHHAVALREKACGKEEDAIELLPVATIANHGGERRGEREPRSAPESYRLGSVVAILPLPASTTRERDRAEREDSRGSPTGRSSPPRPIACAAAIHPPCCQSPFAKKRGRTAAELLSPPHCWPRRCRACATAASPEFHATAAAAGNATAGKGLSCSRCCLRWLPGCRQAGSETAAVSVQPFLLRSRVGAEVLTAVDSGQYERSQLASLGCDFNVSR